MGIEIERKFLVRDTAFLAGLEGERMVQGYLANAANATVRVRLAGGRACLTVKGNTSGISRAEFDYEIPAADGESMLATLCEGSVISKTRYRIAHEGHEWEVDVFDGDNAGLVIAEIELESEDEPFARPQWLGAEVSADPRYYNAWLARCPYRDW